MFMFLLSLHSCFYSLSFKSCFVFLFFFFNLFIYNFFLLVLDEVIGRDYNGTILERDCL